MNVNSNSKRNHILAAASFLVKTRGVEKLTLEAAAKEAGVSKGGLLHHFPSKEALIKGMVEEIATEFVTDIQDRVNRDTMENGKWSRAYLTSTYEDIAGNGISTALTAALFTNPELLGKLQTQYAIWQRNLENDGIDPVRSTLVRLAADGLWFAEMFGLGKLDDELREKVLRELSAMTE
ncbi:TetR/AcrR family transcriptional regulator [Paenibacillus alba]|uniref:TetR/AcrR family transcriptional regulator n=1 Tax=Paenibacillus alba TaxID=1197127 RepID=UPI0015667E3D|nr:TetR/AcrR family transcriptional regulator [Paenibacillus alba]NQX71644.1 TetR/AcrR family transcriptional regulator [Paenibacillus alba]